MLNSLADAIETLEQAGAVVYEITQPGNLKLRGEADNTNDLLDKFQRDWNKLSSGVYKVDYSKSTSDKRSGLCFRVSKVAEQSAGAGVGYAPPDQSAIMGLQQQVWNLQAESQLRDLRDSYEKQIATLKAKHAQPAGGEIGLDSIAGIVAGLDKAHDIMRMAKGFAPLINAAPAVAGAPTEQPGDFDQAATDRLTVALQSLVASLGDETVLGALEQLAAKAQANPANVKSKLGFLSML